MTKQFHKQHHSIYNYNGAKKFTALCSSFSTIEYARMFESRFRTVLYIIFNSKEYEIIVFPSILKAPAKVARIIERKKSPQKAITRDEEIQAFYIQNNIKEIDFHNFIQNLPSTRKNGKFVYCKICTEVHRDI